LAIQERDPRAYELMTVFIPELSEEDNQAQIEKVSAYITNAGGTVKETLTSSPWGRRRLAYTIRFNNVDYRDGFYTVYHFDSVPSFLTELERDLKLDTSTMRYLLVHDDPKAGEKFPQEDGEEGVDEDATPAETASAPAAAAATETAAQEASAATENAAEEATESETPAVSASEPTEADAEDDSEAATDTATTDSEETPSDDETTENNDESSEKE
jgi:small subunit ribosomal protein S6